MQLMVKLNKDKQNIKKQFEMIESINQYEINDFPPLIPESEYFIVHYDR
jgi:hypothetical protein